MAASAGCWPAPGWYWNRYPGIACDIESYTYLPLLEEVGYVPKEKYSFGREILEHSQAIARKFDLYRDVCFQTRVEELRWDEDEARWIVTTNRGDRMKAHYLCLATGPLNRPKLPGIPGIEDFEGHSFHASRWDYEYTGGDSEGNPHRPAGQARRHHRHRRDLGAVRPARRRVGRAPLRVPAHAVVDRREEQPAHGPGVGEGELKPGWHQHRMDNFNAWSRACRSPRTW